MSRKSGAHTSLIFRTIQLHFPVQCMKELWNNFLWLEDTGSFTLSKRSYYNLYSVFYYSEAWGDNMQADLLEKMEYLYFLPFMRLGYHISSGQCVCLIRASIWHILLKVKIHMFVNVSIYSLGLKLPEWLHFKAWLQSSHWWSLMVVTVFAKQVYSYFKRSFTKYSVIEALSKQTFVNSSVNSGLW